MARASHGIATINLYAMGEMLRAFAQERVLNIHDMVAITGQSKSSIKRFLSNLEHFFGVETTYFVEENEYRVTNWGALNKKFYERITIPNRRAKKPPRGSRNQSPAKNRSTGR